MRSVARSIFITLLLISMQVMAEAPVVDDSENFALLEEQPQAAEELPVAHESYNIRNDQEEPSQAHDNLTATTRNTELLNKIQALQQDVQDLRGQLEVQTHELNELKQQQLSFYQDLDNRLNTGATPKSKPQKTSALDQPSIAAEPTTAAQPAPEIQAVADIQSMPKPVIQNAASTAARLNPADEQISYLAAYELVKQKQFAEATLALQQFIAKYPRGGYSANAHYWLGELYLSKKEYANAISHFDTVIQEFKSSGKYAPCRLKLGYALAESGRIGEAKEQLTTVMKLFPDTTTAHLAHVKLETLGG